MTRDLTRLYLPPPTTFDGEVGAKMTLSSRPIDPSTYFTQKLRETSPKMVKPAPVGAGVLCPRSSKFEINPFDHHHP